MHPIREPLDRQHFDVAVIGGGINGVAIARECARAGRRVLVVEQADFSSGTTSRATRIIHGGLRYLEHGEIGLVRESLRERERLLKERPHLVRPLDFVLAMPPHSLGRRNALAIRVALWLYRRASGSRTRISAGDLANLEAALDGGLELNLFSYEDAQCEFPERLVAEWMSEAMHAGAVLRNHTEALEILVQDGKARGLRIRDRLNAQEFEISADWIVNASGPWADEVLSDSNLEKEPLIGGVRGAHIVLPVFPGAPSQALYAEVSDGRQIFVVPWTGQVLVGTTEVPQTGDPGTAEPSSAEVIYLLNSVRRLFPRAGVTAADIRYTYAGVRPLPYSPGEASSAIPRGHRLHDHLEDGVAGLITVIGGKLTTAASLARSCARMIGVRVPEPRATMVAVGPAAGIENTLAQWSHAVSSIAGIPAQSASAIAEWHGRQALCIARMAAGDPRLQQTLCPHSDHIVAEAVEAIHHESAVTLGDILLRRVPVALGGCWDRECTRTAAERIGIAAGWSDHQCRAEIESFTEERRRFLHPEGVAGMFSLLPIDASPLLESTR